MPIRRNALGQITKGSSLNPGGRPKLPQEFRDKGPEFLAAMEDIALDPAHEHHFEALKWCAERVYGKSAPEAPEVETPDPSTGLGAALRERREAHDEGTVH